MPTSIEHKLTTIISLLLDEREAAQADRLQAEKNQQTLLLAIADLKTSLLLIEDDLVKIKQILGLNDVTSFKVTIGAPIPQ